LARRLLFEGLNGREHARIGAYPEVVREYPLVHHDVEPRMLDALGRVHVATVRRPPEPLPIPGRRVVDLVADGALTVGVVPEQPLVHAASEHLFYHILL
jgi:hypothetical protein